MGRFLDTIRRDHPAYRMEASDDGYVLVRRDGHDDQFNELARDLINDAGEDFAVFPTSDGNTGYERLFVIPL